MTSLKYTRIFVRPPTADGAGGPPARGPRRRSAESLRPLEASVDAIADARDAPIYEYTDEIELAVNVAIATNRPLLVRGPSGVGKSSLARNLAMQMKRGFVEQVVTSRMQARDLQYVVDLVKRLGDAEAGHSAREIDKYVGPCALWWAFDHDSATAQANAAPGVSGSMQPVVPPPQGDGRYVLLVDEIDKADPDVPNDLLVSFGSLLFRVPELGNREIRATRDRAPIVVVTTNNERQLPPAFLRRCVHLEIPKPDRDRLALIGKAWFPGLGPTVEALADLLAKDRPEAERPSPAEFVDAIRACSRLSLPVDDQAMRSELEKLLRSYLVGR